MSEVVVGRATATDDQNILHQLPNADNDSEESEESGEPKMNAESFSNEELNVSTVTEDSAFDSNEGENNSFETKSNCGSCERTDETVEGVDDAYSEIDNEKANEESVISGVTSSSSSSIDSSNNVDGETAGHTVGDRHKSIKVVVPTKVYCFSMEFSHERCVGPSNAPVHLYGKFINLKRMKQKCGLLEHTYLGSYLNGKLCAAMYVYLFNMNQLKLCCCFFQVKILLLVTQALGAFTKITFYLLYIISQRRTKFTFFY